MSQSLTPISRHGKPLQIKSAIQYFEMYEQVVSRLPFSLIEQAIAQLLTAHERRQNVFLFGNGGSAALASHFACDLGKGTLNGNNGKRFRVLALTDNVPLLTAWANDTCYENIFAEQIQNFVEPGDIAFAISGSGNSPNVLRALEVARNAGAINIGLAGFEGGKMKRLCNPCIIIPSNNMQVVEDLHLSVTHSIFSVVKCRLESAESFQVAVGGAGSD
ncbi:MAG TPA: SIS domain-containing protein [Terriglobales bacterium]